MRALIALVVVWIVGGCASVDPYAHAPINQHLQREDAAGDCARLLRDVDAQVDAAGVRDAAAPRVPGFPYLRVDRFAASLGDRAAQLRSGGFALWSELMASADRLARAAELANAGQSTPAAALDACRYLLAVADVGELSRLQAAAQVPDDYSTALRVFGLYPLTRLAFAAGIREWQRGVREVFDRPADALPVLGVPQRYRPVGTQVVLIAPPRSVPLGLPAPSRRQLHEWAARHAPVLEVDTLTADDRIGTLHWSVAGEPVVSVDAARPVAYVRSAYTHFGGRTRMQLVYTFWFPARPASQALDLLAGRLDGLLWRVTLDDNGMPLVYDSIHACGCYHLFFPTDAVSARPQPPTLDEGLFAPQVVPALAPGQRLALRVAARTHYLERVTVVPDDQTAGTVYALLDENDLRSLPWPAGGTRSAYDSAGFVPGSERLERWLFWPMGIASAGQMRQWGRHATAFVGRRHFDDARLLDQYFVPRMQAAAAD